MKRVIFLLLILALLLTLVSCGKDPDAHAVVSELISAYGAEGIIYSSGIPEGEEGYIDEALFRMIYSTEEPPPENYAVFLNSHAGYGAECGVFVSRDAAQTEQILALCRARIALLDPRGECGVVIKRGNAVFYSTLRDSERAERLLFASGF